VISKPTTDQPKPWPRDPARNPESAPPPAAARPRLGLLRRRRADSPAEIAWPGWRAALRRTLREMLSERISIVAAGCAFYATLALFPAISMLISVYGLLFDPVTILPQLAFLQDLLPPAAFQLIADRVQVLVSKPQTSLGLNLVISTVVTLWSSASGAKSVITALNLAYQEHETRGFLRYQMVAFAFTLAMILGTAAGLGLLVALPATLQLLGIDTHQLALIHAASWAMLVTSILLGLALLYRYGPSRSTPRWRWVTPGSLAATTVWVFASALFSWYVATLASYDATYGSLGTVVAVMMWFYVTAYAVLLGAELNAELESQTLRDSMAGPAPKADLPANDPRPADDAPPDGGAPSG
jgi:membrane protein